MAKVIHLRVWTNSTFNLNESNFPDRSALVRICCKWVQMESKVVTVTAKCKLHFCYRSMFRTLDLIVSSLKVRVSYTLIRFLSLTLLLPTSYRYSKHVEVSSDTDLRPYHSERNMDVNNKITQGSATGALESLLSSTIVIFYLDIATCPYVVWCYL